MTGPKARTGPAQCRLVPLTEELCVKGYPLHLAAGA